MTVGKSEKSSDNPASETSATASSHESEANENPEGDQTLEEFSRKDGLPTDEHDSAGSDAETGSAVDSGEEDEADEWEALRAENARLRDESLRAYADAENARKRAQTEISNARRFALEGFASELLNVRDSLDLAKSVDLDGAEGVVERVVEGLELTLKQLDSAFEQFSVFEISPEVGDKLDPESHQAMTLAPSSDVAPNHICQVIQKGYRLHDRLLRPARVIVAKAPEGED
ncbi:MAG TPA: nucleotide exchange factor GrpE [Gammaproteobacteria bacterium]|nr:nucleotide exchange factor GrpE [Gammaproteobacteria bacterium]|tara:strand:+ start:28886 stop:29578 length:693 start_codon:yes stop_codon:yes gene_type:complete